LGVNLRDLAWQTTRQRFIAVTIRTVIAPVFPLLWRQSASAHPAGGDTYQSDVEPCIAWSK